MGDKQKQLSQKLLTHPTLHLTLIAAILFAIGWQITPKTFISSDVGLRYLQIRSLIDQSWRTLAIPYPVEIDPDFEYVPYYYAYSLINGRLFLNISPFFPYLASFLFAGIGIPGIVITPIIGTLLTAWGVYKLVTCSQIRWPLLAMWATAFATPLLFYSIQFWDHSLGTGLTTLGVAFLAQGMMTQKKWQIAVGGVLLGLALGQRPELYVFVIVVSIAWIITNARNIKTMAAFVGGGLAGVLPVWILQYLWVGHPLGMATATHLFEYSKPDSYAVVPYNNVIITPAIKMGRLLFEIESRDPVTFSAAIFAIIGLLLLVFAIRVPRYQTPNFLYSGTILTLIGYLTWTVVAWKDTITGLVSTCAFLAFAFTIVNKSNHNELSINVYRFILVTAFLFVAIMLLVWPAFGGLQWGARYLLPTYPLIVYLAFYSVHHHMGVLKLPLQTALKTSFILLIITSSIQQFVGIRHPYGGTKETTQASEAIRAIPADYILTNHPFLPSHMTLVEDKQFLFINDSSQLTSLLPALYRNDVHKFALHILSSDDFTVPDEIGNMTITQIDDKIYQLDMKE